MIPELTPLPMEEALDFWRDKTKLGPAEFRRLTAAAKVKAFAVTGIAKGAELDTVYNALFKAMEKGTTFEQFKAECGDIFTRRGWTGKRAWRVDSIFRTNIQTAYNVGRYTQLAEMTDTFPFWKYSAVNDSRTRPTHLAMNGKVFPANHPFWDQWYPPNGFRCRCSVIPLTASQVKKRGLKVESDVPEMIEPIDPVTGNTMPAMQLLPDPGFAHHPGKAYWAPTQTEGEIRPLVGKAISVKPPLSEIDPRHIKPYTADDLMPSGLAPEAYVTAFLREFGVDDLNGEKFITLPGESGQVLPVNKGLFVDRRDGSWKVEKTGRERYVKLLARTIQDPYEAWLVPAEVSGRIHTTINLIRLFGGEPGKIGGFVVWSLVGDRWMTATTFMAAPGSKKKKLLNYLERQRVGRLLYREEL